MTREAFNGSLIVSVRSVTDHAVKTTDTKA